MDFVTVVFNDVTEINLLKLQALSLKFVDYKLINNIIIMFNDNKNLNQQFTKQFYNDIIQYYPENLKIKIKLIFLQVLDLDFINTDWFTQQLVKIQIAKIIQSKYYLMLDSKNHFIKHTTKKIFFDEDDRPYIYFNDVGDIFSTYYQNCLDYFHVKCPNQKPELGTLKIQTTTPFLFTTQQCLDLIEYVEKKENIPFHKFFMESKKYTEFYFYYSYLIYSEYYNNYHHNTSYHPVITIGHQDPKEVYYNTWHYKKQVLDSEDIFVFSLHRNSLSILDNEYKQSLIEFYNNIFKNETLVKNILPFLYAT
jgi:hypothetical protein